MLQSYNERQSKSGNRQIDLRRLHFPTLPSADLVSLHRIYRTEAVEILDLNVPGPCGLLCPDRAALRHLLLLLLESCLARRGLARLLSLLTLKRPLIGVELGLSPNIDPVLRRSGIYVIQFPLVRHGRASAHG